MKDRQLLPAVFHLTNVYVGDLSRQTDLFVLLIQHEQIQPCSTREQHVLLAVEHESLRRTRPPNNFCEFGVDKNDALTNSGRFIKSPWKVSIEGECEKGGVMDLEDVLKGETLEERVYRHRCVEGWSLISPWIGFPLASLIKKVQPTSRAKFVEFTSAADPKAMPGVRNAILNWPYREGLRMAEAMPPLTLLVVGLYGEVLPAPDGAPLRLAVPWKYGFKHAKSIVRIRFVEKQPINSWQQYAANEYGFYANVNPTVDHPRWSQATERRIGEFLRRKTLMFNGYADQVQSLYAGMDLRRNY